MFLRLYQLLFQLSNISQKLDCQSVFTALLKHLPLFSTVKMEEDFSKWRDVEARTTYFFILGVEMNIKMSKKAEN